MADVSGVHAGIYRDAEGYTLEALRPVLVNDRSVTRSLLQDNDLLTLGRSCRLLFRQPVPANPTARLDLLSGHRLPAGLDGVVLMGETLLLADSNGHLPLDAEGDCVVLFRHKDGLGLRYDQPFQVNGSREQGRILLAPSSVVVAERFSFAIEPAT
ncbi:MAG: FHA domain-containing protein [Gemmataceae bacterium]